MDEAYSAYAAAENNFFNSTDNGNNNANYANYYDSKQGIVRKYCEKPCLADPVWSALTQATRAFRQADQLFPGIRVPAASWAEKMAFQEAFKN